MILTGICTRLLPGFSPGFPRISYDLIRIAYGDVLGTTPVVLGGPMRSLEVLGGPRRSWEVLEGPGRSWEVLGGPGRS